MAPRHFGRYEILDCLGRGGMGVVYRAHDPALQRDVAIKVLSGDLLLEPEARARFHREGRALAALSHPGIVTILDVGEQNETPYLVTEFLRGSDLARRLREGPPLSLAQKLDVIAGLCESIAAAHEVGIVHCDIKPANIWLLQNGAVKVLDFGIARGAAGLQTRSSGMGSPHYMAPEQLSGGEIDRRSDIFSIGVVMYELFAGCRPFSGDTPTAVMFQILNGDPPDLATLDPGLPAFAIQAVARALQKAPEHRFQAVPELRGALETKGAPDLVDAGLAAGRLVYVEPELRPDELIAARPLRLSHLAAGLALAVVASLGVYYAAPPEPGDDRQTDAIVGESEGTALETQSPAEAEPIDAAPTLRVETTPTGATFSIEGVDGEFATPAVIPLPPGDAVRFSFRKQGYQVAERMLTAEHQERGLLEVPLEPVRMIAVRATGDYEFEVLIGDRVMSAAAKRHELNASSGSTVTFRSGRHLLDETVRVGGHEVAFQAPTLGGIRLRVADSLMRCEARLASQRGSRRRAVERHLGHPPFEEPLSIVPGRYDLTFACPDSRPGVVRTFAIIAGQVVTLRVVAGPQ
jgi:hypothetical protein